MVKTVAILTSLIAAGGAAQPWMVTADPAKVRAQKLLKALNLTEKLHFLKGNNTMKPYVGGVSGNGRHGIPDLTLNDGPQGFRDNDGHPGTSTAVPSGLSIAASWDPEIARLWGQTMGEEFLGKGSNVQLGPGLCVARVPYNGRNFEYMSGEDPHLGYVLGQPAIEGIQSTGVIANAKHWVVNSQETNRTTQSAEVDERTLREIYYPPFEGAIKAGVGSFMCSYNKINGKWSCENPETLRDLKEGLGFDGWVMSDWGATHSASILEGLDQEMPGGSKMDGAPGDDGVCCHDLCRLVENGTVKEATIDASALRVLTPMFQMGLFDREPSGAIDANVSSEAHNAAARKMASASMVLLKNEDILPLVPGKLANVALIGQQARDPVVGGGGSGSVAAPYVVSPLTGIRAHLGLRADVECGSQKAIASGCADGPEFLDTDILGHDLLPSPAKLAGTAACCALCSTTAGCAAYSFYHGDGSCYLKSQSGGRSQKKSQDTGLVKGKLCVKYDDGHDLDRAATLAAASDVAIVFASTKSGEGKDRDNLSLFDGWNGDAGSFSYDELIEGLVPACQRSGTPLVVVMVSPGAVLTPWRADAQGIIAAFMPGQEYGNAVADLLFGTVEPSARLPLTFPAEENQWGFTEAQWPGIEDRSLYSEKLEVGYRYYDAHDLEPAFPFGHGLSYTSFTYSDLEASQRGVRFTLTNSGARDGVEVPQLYLGFPDSAGEPPRQLKGFRSVRLTRGQSKQVNLPLDDRAVSIWDTNAGAWAVQLGTFKVFVGSSSRDARLTGSFEVSDAVQV